ncbi:MAG: leucine-rich repeat protein [Tannerella sp.]|nr:leucine-rich repeat protein [Tannerella sp.]
MSVGTSGFDCTQTKFNSQTYLRIAGRDIFKVARERGDAVSLISCFQGCSSLQELPEGIFDGLDIRDASALLSNVPLQSLPVGLLKDAPNLTNLYGAFYGLKVEEYPDDMFSDTSKVTSFVTAFRNNTNLKKLPALKGLNAATTVEGMFYGCPNLETVPDGYFYTAINILNADNLFYGCTKLAVSDPEMLKNSTLMTRMISGLYQTATANAEVIRMLENKPALSLFEQFMHSTLIVDMPAEYLENIQTAGWSSVTARNFISNCPNLRTAVIPENFLYIGSRTFYNLTSCEWIAFKATTPPSADVDIISQDVPVVYVPDAAVDTYKAATGFAGYITAGGTIKGISEKPQ